jgi:NADP-dependent 3-hydroxy acid dehydrogenase YdfG
MNNNITGKVIVITGASSGLGEATARHLAFKGASLVLGARRIDKLEAIARDLRAAGTKVEVLTTDVTNAAQVQALVQKGIDTFGRIDVLINNAGLMAIAPLKAGKVDEWDRMIDINIKGVLYGIAAALPVFRAQGSGHFINLASVAGLKVSSPGGTVYSGTKFAVRAISEGLRHEVGGSIRTTIISPGAVDSELKLGSTDEASIKSVGVKYEIAIPADSVARAIAYAIEQRPEVDVNEIVLRPALQDY